MTDALRTQKTNLANVRSVANVEGSKMDNCRIGFETTKDFSELAVCALIRSFIRKGRKQDATRLLGKLIARQGPTALSRQLAEQIAQS